MKKKNFKVITLLIAMAFLVSLLAACNSSSSNGDGDKDKGTAGEKQEENKNEDGNKEEEENHEPVTIRWAHQWGEEHFLDNYGELLNEKFPWVTIEVQEAGTDHTETLENVIAAGKSPDVVTMGLVTHAQFLEELGLAYDHSEIIEKTGFDLSALEPSIVEYTRNRDPEKSGRLFIIPNNRPTWSLHYNKDVFDILGVDYPEDGMTWTEVVELAKDLTREVNGVEYRGLDLDVPYDAWTQFSTSSVNPDTDEVQIADNEAYKKFFQMIQDTISIPGNYPADEPGSLLMNWGSLFGEGNIAMAPAATNWGWLENDNIDIATYPTWEGYEGLNPQPNAGGFAITEPSEHKELVMDMIAYLLSDEVQMEKSKNGSTSILVNPDVHAVFGDERPELEGKNLDSLFKNEYATGPDKVVKYGSIPWAEMQDFANSGKDVNEYLRIYQEEMEELVRTQKAQE